MVSILKVLSRNIKHYRIQCGFSQEVLAERAGLHRTYVGAVERSERNISAENIQKLAEALCVEPHQLLKDRKR